VYTTSFDKKSLSFHTKSLFLYCAVLCLLIILFLPSGKGILNTVLKEQKSLQCHHIPVPQKNSSNGAARGLTQWVSDVE
jgi:hypothetical protein